MPAGSPDGGGAEYGRLWQQVARHQSQRLVPVLGGQAALGSPGRGATNLISGWTPTLS